MSTNIMSKIEPQQSIDFLQRVKQFGETFAKRAIDYDKQAAFVSQNYKDMREQGLFSAAIPQELGGGGASYAQLSAIIRELGHYCGSTALSFAMHSHPVAANRFKSQHNDEAATKTLQKIAANDLIIAGTGANDWMDSSGEAVKVESGFRISAHKRFVSGAPGAQVFLTSVRYPSESGTEILHFATPFASEGLQLMETWDALGMRGTGSHDVVMKDVFVPDTAIVARRPAGEWHPMWNVILPIALPLITSAYVGMAEAAVELAKKSAAYKKTELASVVGEMINSLTTAQLALEDMVRKNDNYGFSPNLDLANEILVRKTIATESIKKTIELAAELVGGPGFIRGHAMERIVRDVRAMHYHPLPARRQIQFSGRVALGFDPIK